MPASRTDRIWRVTSSVVVRGTAFTGGSSRPVVQITVVGSTLASVSWNRTVGDGVIVAPVRPRHLRH